MRSRSFETRSLPSSLAATHRGFAFYVAFPKSSFRPVGLPIYAWHDVASAKVGRSSHSLRSRTGGRDRQLLFDLRENAFHLFFAEGAQRLTLGVTERAVL